MLKDRFDTPPEQDEPQQKDMEHDHDELYDDDQFFKEPEAIPPEPKLQGDLAKERSSDLIPAIVSHQASSPRPPMRNRDDSTLEGKSFMSVISRYVMVTRKFFLKVFKQAKYPYKSCTIFPFTHRLNYVVKVRWEISCNRTKNYTDSCFEKFFFFFCCLQ